MIESAPKSYNYDVCFVSFSEPFLDGRTLNIVKITAKLGFKVCLIAIGKETDLRIFKGYGVTFIPLKSHEPAKASVRWTKFRSEAKKKYTNINSKYYFACDVYSLPITNDLKKQANLFGRTSKLIYDSREIYSQLGTYEGKGIKQAIITQAEKMYVRNVNKMVTSGPFDSTYLRNHFKHSLPYTEILNLPPHQSIVKTNILRKKLDVGEETLIIIYQGVLLKGRGLIPAMQAIKNIENVKLVIVGKGEYYNNLKKFVINNKLDNKVVFTGAVPYIRLHEITCSADLGLALFEPISKSYELALPNKLFEYIMAGLPVLSTDLPQMSNIIKKEEVGLTVSKDCNPDEIAEKIEYFKLHQNRLPFIENAQKVAPNYGYESQKDKIKKLFE